MQSIEIYNGEGEQRTLVDSATDYTSIRTNVDPDTGALVALCKTDGVVVRTIELNAGDWAEVWLDGELIITATQ